MAKANIAKPESRDATFNGNFGQVRRIDNVHIGKNPDFVAGSRSDGR